LKWLRCSSQRAQTWILWQCECCCSLNNWAPHPVIAPLRLFFGMSPLFIRDPTQENSIGSICTPLIMAAYEGQMEVVKSLLAAGADATVKSSCVSCPLDYANDCFTFPF
jgi:ankyrin repeat protein